MSESESMKNKERVPARDSYRIDHTDFKGEYWEFFYFETFDTRKAAEKYIDKLNPKYRDKLRIVKFHEPAHDQYDLGSMRL